MNWTQLSRLPLDEILAWADSQPWCHAMAECQQDAGWHAEGDVWTHTKMVCHQLPHLDEWNALSPAEQLVLIFTALLHDSGKPQTSQWDAEAQRIRSPKHAVVGEHLARNVLRDVNCPLSTREEICRMVRLHGRPAFLLEKPDPNCEVVTLSWSVCNKLLYLFALADSRGRDTAEMTRPEDNLHLWKAVCQENNCFDQAYRFANDQARFLFLRQPQPNLHYVPYEDYRCTVTMLSGLPGSGKDTWLQQHRPDLAIISLDDIRGELDVEPTDNQGEVAQLARERCREYLRDQTPFAFNATNLLRQTRQRWIDLFHDYNAGIELIYLEPPLTRILDQNRRRTRIVPERVIRDLARKLEPPTWAECHQLQLLDGR